jgi:hypothetical protein
MPREKVTCPLVLVKAFYVQGRQGPRRKRIDRTIQRDFEGTRQKRLQEFLLATLATVPALQSVSFMPNMRATCPLALVKALHAKDQPSPRQKCIDGISQRECEGKRPKWLQELPLATLAKM